MQPNATRLTPQQEQAAEMLTAGCRLVAVARALRVDRATLWRWTKLPAFQSALATLQAIARRDVAEKMRCNVLAAAEVLGAILDDARASRRDRISAARVILVTVRGPFDADATKLQPDESGPGWPEIVLDTARRAGALATHGLQLPLAQTPGAAWKASGLEAVLPGSFARVRAMADHPADLRVECERILSAFRDQLDAKALGG